MSDSAARLQRERDFHDDRYADEHRQAAAKYYAVDTGSVAYRSLLDETAGPGVRVLEYGCGTGSRAPDLVDGGAAVVGIDISGVGVSAAAASEVDANFLQMDAEHLGFADESFDLVCGSGILHHLDLQQSIDEVARVLRPGGTGVFSEPLGTNPLINLYRRLTPSMRTPDEHPLVPADFDLMRDAFTEVTVEYHNFLSLAGVVARRIPVIGARLTQSLQRADQMLFHRISPSRRLAWVAVIRLRA